jgi:hypothetical protein
VAVGVGAYLISMDGRQGCDLEPPALECPTLLNSDGWGYGVIAGGAVLAGAGVYLWIKDRPSDRGTRAAILPVRGASSDNQGGGVNISGSPFTLRNNFLTANGQSGAGGSIFGGISISNGSAASPQVLAFNTITDNSASNTAFAAGAICTVTTPTTASSNIVYGNVGGLAEIAGGRSWAYSDIEGGQAGTGNIDMDPQCVNAAGGNFHLTSSSPCRNAADPDASLAVDVDGDPRREGNAPDMGADEVVP